LTEVPDYDANYAEVHCNASDTGTSTDGEPDDCSFTEPAGAIPDIGATCTDSCLGSQHPGDDSDYWVGTATNTYSATADTQADGTLKLFKHWSRDFDPANPLGTYYITYTCQDADNNNASLTRTVVFIDTAKPTIHVRGTEPTYTLQATREDDYEDEGAECYDNIDNEINHAVMVSGDNVNMRIPGTYNIFYDCRDISGNQAAQRQRTVIIEDTQCPEITMRDANGPVEGDTNEIEWEAGVAYEDWGCTATDDLDGDISDHVWADGDTINTHHHFRSQPSCRAIYEEQKQFDLEHKDGFYHITRPTAEDVQKRVLVWCDMKNAYKPADDEEEWYGQTWYAAVCGKRIFNFREESDGGYDDDNSCADVGLDVASKYDLGMNDTGVHSNIQNCVGVCGRTKFEHYVPLANSINSCNDADCWREQSSDYYLCTIKEPTGVYQNTQYLHPYTSDAQLIATDKITVAETGKYVISYHVSDWAGNTECTPKQRTVVVRDTMPPVIQLYVKTHEEGNVWRTTRPVREGHWNPAWTAKNPQFQVPSGLVVPPDNSFSTTPSDTNTFSAERSATVFNGWVVGAIASAVSGIALLSHSLRRSTEQHIDV